MRTLIAALLVSAAALAGCESVPKRTVDLTYDEVESRTAFNGVNYKAVDELMKRYQGAVTAAKQSYSPFNAPFIVATLVNIDQLDESSTLGRVVSEQIVSRLTQLGYGVVELKLRNGVFIRRREGEFLLTREVNEMATTHNAQAVIVGTYARSADLLHINLRTVNPSNNVILSSHDYALPLDTHVRSLMRR